LPYIGALAPLGQCESRAGLSKVGLQRSFLRNSMNGQTTTYNPALTNLAWIKLFLYNNHPYFNTEVKSKTLQHFQFDAPTGHGHLT
jgi:hypothetical protein